MRGGREQRDLYGVDKPEANHAAILSLKPLLDVQEMTNGLELEPFKTFKPLGQEDGLFGACFQRAIVPGRAMSDRHLPMEQEGGGPMDGATGGVTSGARGGGLEGGVRGRGGGGRGARGG